MNTTQLLAWLRAYDLPNGIYAVVIVTAATLILAQFLHALASIRSVKARYANLQALHNTLDERFMEQKACYDAVLNEVEGQTLHLPTLDMGWQYGQLLREYAEQLRDLSDGSEHYTALRAVGRALEDVADELDPTDDEDETGAGDELVPMDAVAEVAR